MRDSNGDLPLQAMGYSSFSCFGEREAPGVVTALKENSV